MLAQFDSGSYDQTLTRVFKIPYDAPDSLNSETFERINGDFEQDGEVYRVIKRRLYRDTFHIVYMKDERGTKIHKALNEVAKTFADQPTEKSQGKTIVPSFIKEYVSRNPSAILCSIRWEQKIIHGSASKNFIDSFEAFIVHPPERA